MSDPYNPEQMEAVRRIQMAREEMFGGNLQAVKQEASTIIQTPEMGTTVIFSLVFPPGSLSEALAFLQNTLTKNNVPSLLSCKLEVVGDNGHDVPETSGSDKCPHKLLTLTEFSDLQHSTNTPPGAIPEDIEFCPVCDGFHATKSVITGKRIDDGRDNPSQL